LVQNHGEVTLEIKTLMPDVWAIQKIFNRKQILVGQQ